MTFKVMLCPHCERTTVVDDRHQAQHCDWTNNDGRLDELDEDVCGKLFLIEGAIESTTTMEDLRA